MTNGENHRPGRVERILLLLGILSSIGFVLLRAQHQPQSFTAVATPSGSISPTTQTQLSDSLIKSPTYVGPPPQLIRNTANKFKEKRVLDLNSVDSLTLLRVPGIGPAFSHRILDYRKRLGGYYTVYQLQEVYGVDESKFLDLRSWFKVSKPPTQYPLPALQADSIPYHLYLSRDQRRALARHIKKHGPIHSWQELRYTDLFGVEDSIRLSPYFPEQ